MSWRPIWVAQTTDAETERLYEQGVGDTSERRLDTKASHLAPGPRSPFFPPSLSICRDIFVP